MSQMKIHMLFVSYLFALALASPLRSRQSITTLTAAQISTFKPFSFFASAGYCSSSTTLTWSCGANCNANPDFIPVASGGDGSSTQFWFVGFSPSLKTIIVSHQGTDPFKITPLLADANAILGSLDSSLFPGVSSSIQVHTGFANQQAKTATEVLSAVETALSTHGSNHVTFVGHSLGAAIALLDAVYLPLRLGTTIQYTTIAYGLPRVGNQAFADYIDAHVSLTHINNKEDIVPILPGEFLGYHHPSGEVHIQDSGTWVACPGQDNSSDECIVGDVENIFEGSVSNHDGPYDGVEMGC